MPVNPVDWVRAEDVIANWAYQAGDIDKDRVRIQTPRGQGEARGPAPKATISLVSLVPLQTQGRETQARVMQQRCTVTAVGPGEVGVDFFPGHSQVPQRISIVSGIGDPPAVSAAALLGALQGALPAGYTASADGADPASILIDGTAATPLFASLAADPALLTVTTPMPRYPVILRLEHAVVWRITVRAEAVAGPNFAANAISKMMVHRRSWCDQYMYPIGFRPAGTPQATPFVPPERDESLGTLDIRFIGLMTGAEATTAMRVAGLTLTSAAAA